MIVQSLLLVWLDAASDSGGEEHVWLHDGDTLGVFSAELCVDEEVDEIVFSGFLEGLDGEALESDVLFVVALDEFSDELGEWEFSDQEVSGLLILLDFASGDCSLLGSSDFLDTSLRCASGLTDSLTGDSLTWSFSSWSRFTSSVFGSSHIRWRKRWEKTGSLLLQQKVERGVNVLYYR